MCIPESGHKYLGHMTGRHLALLVTKRTKNLYSMRATKLDEESGHMSVLSAVPASYESGFDAWPSLQFSLPVGSSNSNALTRNASCSSIGEGSRWGGKVRFACLLSAAGRLAVKCFYGDTQFGEEHTSRTRTNGHGRWMRRRAKMEKPSLVQWHQGNARLQCVSHGR